MIRLCAALALAASISEAAGAAPCALAVKPEAVAVENAIDGDTVALDDGREVRLAGVSAPKPPLGVARERWPLAEASRAALEAAAGGRVMELRLASRPSDRYGRLVGFLSGFDSGDHAGVAAGLLARGLLRWSAEGRDCGATLREAEDAALTARLGLWSDPYYAVLDAADGAAVALAAGRFVAAEGRVASVRTAAGRAYVNFGARWREALSLALSEAALRRLGGFEGLGIAAGVRLRVRGVVEARLGPTIVLNDAAQIERLGNSGRSGR